MRSNNFKGRKVRENGEVLLEKSGGQL